MSTDRVRVQRETTCVPKPSKKARVGGSNASAACGVRVTTANPSPSASSSRTSSRWGADPGLGAEPAGEAVGVGGER